MLDFSFAGYYNNERYQWELAKLSPNEFVQFCETGVYPLKIADPPEAPHAVKDPEELGRKNEGAGAVSSDSTLGAKRPGSNRLRQRLSLVDVQRYQSCCGHVPAPLKNFMYGNGSQIRQKAMAEKYGARTSHLVRVFF